MPTLDNNYSIGRCFTSSLDACLGLLFRTATSFVGVSKTAKSLCLYLTQSRAQYPNLVDNANGRAAFVDATHPRRVATATPPHSASDVILSSMADNHHRIGKDERHHSLIIRYHIAIRDGNRDGTSAHVIQSVIA